MAEPTPDVRDLFWDAAVDALEVRRLLREGPELSRRAIMRRLLEYGEWDEIRAFLTLDDIERELPQLRFRSPEVESFWREAVAFWRSRAR
jgi:hypothetical protein